MKEEIIKENQSESILLDDILFKMTTHGYLSERDLRMGLALTSTNNYNSVVRFFRTDFGSQLRKKSIREHNSKFKTSKEITCDLPFEPDEQIVIKKFMIKKEEKESLFLFMFSQNRLVLYSCQNKVVVGQCLYPEALVGIFKESIMLSPDQNYVLISACDSKTLLINIQDFNIIKILDHQNSGFDNKRFFPIRFTNDNRVLMSNRRASHEARVPKDFWTFVYGIGECNQIFIWDPILDSIELISSELKDIFKIEGYFLFSLSPIYPNSLKLENLHIIDSVGKMIPLNFPYTLYCSETSSNKITVSPEMLVLNWKLPYRSIQKYSKEKKLEPHVLYLQLISKDIMKAYSIYVPSGQLVSPIDYKMLMNQYSDRLLDLLEKGTSIDGIPKERGWLTASPLDPTGIYIIKVTGDKISFIGNQFLSMGGRTKEVLISDQNIFITEQTKEEWMFHHVELYENNILQMRLKKQTFNVTKNENFTHPVCTKIEKNENVISLFIGESIGVQSLSVIMIDIDRFEKIGKINLDKNLLDIKMCGNCSFTVDEGELVTILPSKNQIISQDFNEEPSLNSYLNHKSI